MRKYIHMMTQRAMSGKKMRCNTPNENNNSPLENYKVIFRRSTPKGGGGQNLIIAECSPLKT